MALRSNVSGSISNLTTPTGSANARFTQAQAFGTPGAQIYSRASLNPGPTNSGVINMMPQSTIRYNGAPNTNPARQAGNVLGGIYYNIADNSLTNGYNAARGGLNYDIRNFRGGLTNAFAPILNRPVYPSGQPLLYPTSQDFRGPVSGYPFGYADAFNTRELSNGSFSPFYYPYPYANFPTAYSYPSDSAYPNNYANTYPNNSPYGYTSNWPYATSYANPYYDYPLTAPECSSHLGCSSYQHPNDCRSCVSSRGGPRHCADQICGSAIL